MHCNKIFRSTLLSYIVVSQKFNLGQINKCNIFADYDFRNELSITIYSMAPLWLALFGKFHQRCEDQRSSTLMQYVNNIIGNTY